MAWYEMGIEGPRKRERKLRELKKEKQINCAKRAGESHSSCIRPPFFFSFPEAKEDEVDKENGEERRSSPTPRTG